MRPGPFPRPAQTAARVLAISDVYGALTENLSYRDGFSAVKALGILERDVPKKLDADRFKVVRLVADCLCAMAPLRDEINLAPACEADKAALRPAPVPRLARESEEEAQGGLLCSLTALHQRALKPVSQLWTLRARIMTRKWQ